MRRALAALALLAGCLKTGNVVIVDRKTALEQQAAGSYRGLEDELARAGISPRPAPLTRAELTAGGGAGGAGGERTLGDEEAASDPARLDDLLLRRCVGEALDGTIAETAATCTGGSDPARIGRLVERTNRQRMQVWRWIQSRRPGASLEDVRRTWREVHLRGVVCDGQVQRADGAWETKKC